MAKRPKYSRWRRLPPVYRSGEHKLPDAEPQRVSVYIPVEALDLAEAQAVRLGFPSHQEYCTELLLNAIEEERVREQMAEVEARRGPLTGFRAIEDDPEYLAELQAAASAPAPHAIEPSDPAPADEEIRYLIDAPEVVAKPDALPTPDAPAAHPPAVRVTLQPAALAPTSLSPSARVVLRHAAQESSRDDPYAFLPSLRRGEPVQAAELAELAQALHQLENEYRGAAVMDRRLSFALHRLAFESQILHTDAWPGAFDAWTVDMLRSVQEAVERILSGQDIRYYPTDDSPARLDTTPAGTRPARPETLP